MVGFRCVDTGVLPRQHPCAPKEKMSNSSFLNGFLLVAFADSRELQLLHFSLFLGIYLAALLANGLIITAVACDHHLHTPIMRNKELQEALTKLVIQVQQSSTVTITLGADWLESSLAEKGLEVLVDNMKQQEPDKCPDLQRLHQFPELQVTPQLVGGLEKELPGLDNRLTFLDLTERDQEVCEEPPKTLSPLCMGSIFRAVLRMPSEQGLHKAFSMCLPHLAVVSLFLSSDMFTYMKPPSMSSPALDLVVAVVYSVVPPAVNPLLYSMRNKELKNALGKLI
ncbi:olfactory receptor 14J1-like [Struthio camelus]|uniref:olfactory receptor 14J1-like n=1 Tax=Struthio camelus TaxID=8801 RepID=UPI00360422AE